jgi:hypothetical protein
MVGLQLLNLWSLKVMLTCLKDSDGVTTIKPGYQTTGNAHVIWSDELSFTLFPMPGRVYIWRTPKEAYNLECLVWFQQWNFLTEVSWYSILLVPLLPFMAKLLQGSTWTGWVIRRIPWSRHHFETMVQFSKTTVPPLTAGTVQSWFEEHEGELLDLPWPAQLPDLNIIKPLWSVLETRVRNRFPPPTSLKATREDVLQEETYKSLLETVQNWYKSIPRRITAVLRQKVVHHHIVMCIPISRQWLGKHIPMKCMLNNRTSVARQQSCQRAFATTEEACLFVGLPRGYITNLRI